MKPSIGVCYYPEHWPRSCWQRDAQRMRVNGIRWVRIGEFASSRLEPDPGQLDWEWLDSAIDTLAQAGLLRPDDQPAEALAEVRQVSRELENFAETTEPASLSQLSGLHFDTDTLPGAGVALGTPVP